MQNVGRITMEDFFFHFNEERFTDRQSLIFEFIYFILVNQEPLSTVIALHWYLAQLALMANEQISLNVHEGYWTDFFVEFDLSNQLFLCIPDFD